MSAPTGDTSPLFIDFTVTNGPGSSLGDAFYINGLPNYPFMSPQVYGSNVTVDSPLFFELQASEIHCQFGSICDVPGEAGAGGSAVVTLNQIELFASSSSTTPLTGFTYTTASGTAYDVPGGTFVPTATPEPATYAFAIGGIATLVTLRKRFHRA